MDSLIQVCGGHCYARCVDGHCYDFTDTGVWVVIVMASLIQVCGWSLLWHH